VLLQARLLQARLLRKGLLLEARLLRKGLLREAVLLPQDVGRCVQRPVRLQEVLLQSHLLREAGLLLRGWLRLRWCYQHPGGCPGSGPEDRVGPAAQRPEGRDPEDRSVGLMAP
jgi:hypothetical protein